MKTNKLIIWLLLTMSYCGIFGRYALSGGLSFDSKAAARYALRKIFQGYYTPVTTSDGSSVPAYTLPFSPGQCRILYANTGICEFGKADRASCGSCCYYINGGGCTDYGGGLHAIS